MAGSRGWLIVLFNLLIVIMDEAEDSGGYRQEVSRVDFHVEDMALREDLIWYINVVGSFQFWCKCKAEVEGISRTRKSLKRCHLLSLVGLMEDMLTLVIATRC